MAGEFIWWLNLGVLADGILGFYRSSYKDEVGNTKYMATTQMEPTDARRVRLMMPTLLNGEYDA